ncbi:MAG: ABC transporter ATP-binding protein [Firmicutes bacterium]|nr:ABC transporter ATP-binding protein [Bacillota bacterium]
MEKALVVENLEKNYGNLKALKGISFDVSPGEIFALIGPNGAGKTTTLRIIATILSSDGGDVYIYGISVKKQPDKIRNIISYLPEEAGAYKNLTGKEYLRFMASLFAPDERTCEEYVRVASEIADLGDRLKDKISTFSKGMTRKLLLARAVMTRPKLAILDEPTSGLDVINALEIRNTIKRLAKSGMTVLVSSHNMLEIEYLCDRVAIIDKGKILEVGTPEELKKEFGAQNLEEVFAEVAR